MSESKYDIAALRLALGSCDQEEMIARYTAIREQSRLQAAFCEAYESWHKHHKPSPPDPDWLDKKRDLCIALDAAWAALQNHINVETK